MAATAELRSLVMPAFSGYKNKNNWDANRLLIQLHKFFIRFCVIKSPDIDSGIAQWQSATLATARTELESRCECLTLAQDKNQLHYEVECYNDPLVMLLAKP